MATVMVAPRDCVFLPPRTGKASPLLHPQGRSGEDTKSLEGALPSHRLTVEGEGALALLVDTVRTMIDWLYSQAQFLESLRKEDPLSPGIEASIGNLIYHKK